MYKLFLTQRSVNEATSHYLYLIEQAVALSGGESQRIYHVKDIQPDDVVITVEAKDLFLLSLRRPKNKIINWYQGITPEEAYMVYKNPLRKWLWEIFERYSLRKAVLNLFVSNAMHRHYRQKYNYQQNNHLEIPCYNQPLDAKSFYAEGKYTQPTFVYSGSISKWQCLEQVLEIYEEIEIALPHAHLTILTRETEGAAALVQRTQIKNLTIKQVALAEMNEALRPIKYGWLIREDVPVNQVATPTKMNTYLASGVIPIYSDVVHAFRENLDLRTTALKIQAGLSSKEIAQQIIQFEQQEEISPSKLYARYTAVFRHFYTDEKYIQILAHELIELRNL